MLKIREDECYVIFLVGLFCLLVVCFHCYIMHTEYFFLKGRVFVYLSQTLKRAIESIRSASVKPSFAYI